MATSPSPQSSPMPPPQAPSPMGPPQQAPSPLPSPSAQPAPQHHAHSPTNYNQGPPTGPGGHINGAAAVQQGTQTFQHPVGQAPSGQTPVQVTYLTRYVKYMYIKTDFFLILAFSNLAYPSNDFIISVISQGGRGTQ